MPDKFWFFLSYLITTVTVHIFLKLLCTNIWLRSLWCCTSSTNCIQVNMIWHEKRLLIFYYEMWIFVKQYFKRIIILHSIQTWIISRVCVLTVPSPYASHWIKLNGAILFMNRNWIWYTSKWLESVLSWRSWCSFSY